jgi:flagellin-like hook-associated protein FlgL
VAITLGNNIPSLKALRELDKGTKAISKTFERLSTGLRINSASDDAAGLAISSSLMADVRIYSQGLRNISDGIGILDVAVGALEQLSIIATRQLELAEQSANGAYSNQQRTALNNEAQALNREYNRIVQTTSFNGERIFTTNGKSLGIFAGTESDALTTFDLGSELNQTVGTGTFGTGLTLTHPSGTSSYATRFIDINNDGNLDAINGSILNPSLSIAFGNGDGTFENEQAMPLALRARGIAGGDVNADGITDLVIGGILSTNNQAAIYLGNGDGTFRLDGLYLSNGAEGSNDRSSIQLVDFNNDQKLDISIANNESGSVGILLGNGDGTFGSVRTAFVGGTVYEHAIGDVNGDGVLDLLIPRRGANDVVLMYGNGDGTFSTQTTFSVSNFAGGAGIGDLNNDGKNDLVLASRNDATLYIHYNLGNGSFSTAQTLSTGTNAQEIKITDLNGDGALDIANLGRTNGTVSFFLGTGTGSFSPRTTVSSGATVSQTFDLGDINNDGALDLLVASESTGDYFSFLALTQEVPTQSYVDISTMTLAKQSIDLFQEDLRRVSAEIGVIGAHRSRLETQYSAMTQMRDQYQIAESRVMSSDVAVDAAELTRLTIIRQLGVSLLAQNKLDAQLVLTLLAYRG